MARAGHLDRFVFKVVIPNKKNYDSLASYSSLTGKIPKLLLQTWDSLTLRYNLYFLMILNLASIIQSLVTVGKERDKSS